MKPKLIILILLATVLVGCGEAIHVGDVWLYETSAPNKVKSPFPDCEEELPPIQITFRVLEVKDGWVKAINESGRVMCSTEYVFKFGGHKIKQ